MNIFSLPDIIGLIFNLSLAVNILGKSDKKRYSGYWLIAVILLFSLWIFVDLLSLNFADKNTALFAARVTYRIIFLLPAFILSISLKHQSRTKQVNYWLWLLIYAFPVLILSLSFPHFNLKLISFETTEKFRYFALSLSPNIAFYSILILSFIYISLSINIFRNIRRNTIGIYERKYLRLLIIGLSSLFFFFFFIHFISSYLKSYAQLNFLKTSFLFIEIFIFYIISKQFNSDHKKTNSNFYNFVITAFILVVWFLLISYALKIIDNLFKIHTWYFDALQVLTYTLLLLPAIKNLQNFIRSKTNKKVLLYRKNFQKLSQELIDVIPFDIFLNKITFFIKTNFLSKDVFIFNLNEENGYFEFLYKKEKISIRKENRFIKKIDYKDVTDFHNLFHEKSEDKSDNNLKQFLIDRNTRLILPVAGKNKLFMFIALTEKENNKDYQQSEIDILNIFSSEISLYIQRNQVLKKLHEREKEKFRLEKLAALGQLTAGITHEIRNPLNTISSAAQTLSGKKLNSEQQQRMLNYINEEVERISDLMTDFLKLSILKIPEYETTELCKLFEKVKVYVSERNSSVKMAVINKLSENIKTDKKYLYQILINLVSNAVDAIEKNCYNTDFPCSKGLITLNINQTEKSYILKIEDNGSGVPKEIREKIFEPFFTSKENGTGLGLALVSNMVKSLDGSIMLLPSENKTVFKILLPQKK